MSPVTSVRDVKQLLYEETDLPVEEQRLLHDGRMVSVFCLSKGQREHLQRLPHLDNLFKPLRDCASLLNEMLGLTEVWLRLVT